MTPFWDSNSVHIKELCFTKKGVYLENRRNYNRNSHQNQGRFAKTLMEMYQKLTEQPTMIPEEPKKKRVQRRSTG